MLSNLQRLWIGGSLDGQVLWLSAPGMASVIKGGQLSDGKQFRKLKWHRLVTRARFMWLDLADQTEIATPNLTQMSIVVRSTYSPKKDQRCQEHLWPTNHTLHPTACITRGSRSVRSHIVTHSSNLSIRDTVCSAFCVRGRIRPPAWYMADPGVIGVCLGSAGSIRSWSPFSDPENKPVPGHRYELPRLSNHCNLSL